MFHKREFYPMCQRRPPRWNDHEFPQHATVSRSASCPVRGRVSARFRENGRGLPRARLTARSRGGHQGDGRAHRVGSRDAPPLRDRSQSRGRAVAPQHSLDTRARVGGRTAAHSFARAVVHTHRGQMEEALHDVERMADEHSAGCVFLGVDPSLSPLRGQPRYEAVITRVGVSPPRMASAAHTVST